MTYPDGTAVTNNNGNNLFFTGSPGGTGGPGETGGAGGPGVVGNGLSVTNNGNTIDFSGGNGGMGGTNGNGGVGGAGLVGNNITIANNGNTIDVSGGPGGTGGVGGNGGTGGAGFVGNGATITNTGTLIDFRGGPGGPGGMGGNGGTGGAGFVGIGATVTNEGNAIFFQGSIGGTGGAGGRGGDGGAGLIGQRMTFTNTVNGNAITFQGGNGGDGGAGGTGGAGAAGLVGDQLTTINNATGNLGNIQGILITGGNGAAGGAGGIGLIGSNLTIDNRNGSITGGLANAGAGARAYAIQLTGGTNYIGTGGTITGGVNVAGGSFQPALPGSTVGTPLAVGGPLVFAQTSTYQIRLSPTANDSAAATGAATPGGAMVFTSVQPGPAPTPGMRYTILTAAGGVNGMFDPTVGSNLAFFRPVLSYDATDVFLTAAYTYVLPGATLNERSVGAGLNNAARIAGTSNPTILAALNQVPAGAGGAVLDSISGEGIAAAQNIAFGSTALFISSIFDQTTFYGNAGSSPNQITLTAPVPGFTAYAPSDGSFTRTPIHELADLPSAVAPIPAPIFVPQRTWRAWATGFGGVEDFSGNAFPVGSAGQSDSIYGGTLGIDYQLMPNYLAGLAIGGSNGDFSVPGRATSGSTTGGHVAFYDLATFGAFYAASTTSASFYSNQTTRTIAGFGGLAGETDRGNFRSDAYSSKVEFGRHFAAYGGLITPFASIELTELRSYGFTETPLAGAGLFALNVQGQDTASVPSLVGARFQTVLPLGNGLTLSPSLQVAWEHQFSPQRPVLAGLINLPGAVFLTNGASPARDSAAVKAGGELAISRQAALFANFDGDFSGVDRFYGGKGGFKYVW